MPQIVSNIIGFISFSIIKPNITEAELAAIAPAAEAIPNPCPLALRGNN